MAESWTFGVFPDCVPSVNVFTGMSTQWRVGTGGPIGLDYTALPVVMRLARIHPSDRSRVFDDIRVMEDAALEQIRANK